MRSARPKTLGIRWALLALALLLPSSSRAQSDVAPLSAKLELEQRMVTASFDVTAAFTERFRKRLAGGLKSQAVILMELVDRQGRSITRQLRKCTLRLDIWDDILFVKIEDGVQITRKAFVLVDSGLKQCGVYHQVPLVDPSLLGAQEGYRLIVRVALNPVSQELLDKTREFTSNPRGTGGRPRSFFSAVAGLFRSEANAGGATFTFRAGPLEKPKRGAR